MGNLLARILIVYLPPILLLLAFFGFLAYQATRLALEESLAKRLKGVAQAAAALISPDTLLILAPGDDDSRTAKRLRLRLRRLRERTGAARLFILDRELRSLADTRGDILIGQRDYHAVADRSEVRNVFAGKAAASTLFIGKDNRYYKTGYAPMISDGQVVGALGVEGSVSYFATLRELRTSLWIAGVLVSGLLVLLSVFLARRIAQPLQHLAADATRIGAGKLEEPIMIEARGEVALLAATMNEMRAGLLARDQEAKLMLSGIAHEVRNPLGGISLFTGLLRDEVADQPELLNMITRIEKEIDYLGRVVSDFLDYARTPTHAGIAADTLTALSPQKIIHDISELAQSDAKDAGVAIITEGPSWGSDRVDPDAADFNEAGLPKDIQIYGDEAAIRRALINLVRNGIQASGAASNLWIRSGDVDGRPFLEVEDEGEGIAGEDLERVFEPFYSTREKGSGLGLALVRQVAHQHGGEIDIHSENGKGCRIRLYLADRPPSL